MYEITDIRNGARGYVFVEERGEQKVLVVRWRCGYVERYRARPFFHVKW